MTEQNSDAVAYGSVLAILLTSRQPVTVVVPTLAAKLKLTPEAVDKALKQLENDNRITQTISRTVVLIVEPPENVLAAETDPFDEADWEAAIQAQLDAEAKAAKKGRAKS